MPHYTSTSQDALIERVTADFIGQIARRLEMCRMSQSELAQKLHVSEPEVSQILNLNRINLTLKLMTRYALALGMKLAVVAYDDGDPTNQNGPVGSEMFSLSWEKIGKPRDVWSLNEASYATTSDCLYMIRGWLYGSTTSTFSDPSSTTAEFLYIPQPQTQKATLTNA